MSAVAVKWIRLLSVTTSGLNPLTPKLTEDLAADGLVEPLADQQEISVGDFGQPLPHEARTQQEE